MSNEKGGVAKTTSTLSLGAALAELNYRVLLFDLDPQANLSLALGLETGESTVTSANILIENSSVRSAIRKTDIKNLDLVPSSFRIETAEQFFHVCRLACQHELTPRLQALHAPLHQVSCHVRSVHPQIV
jgi:chromosome partitioning protein